LRRELPPRSHDRQQWQRRDRAVLARQPCDVDNQVSGNDRHRGFIRQAGGTDNVAR
jgi:hypothetical protein